MSVLETPCILCDGAVTRPLSRKFGLVIARCTKCGFVYANPRLRKDDLWTRYSAKYFFEEYLPAYGVHDRKVDLGAFDIRYRPMLDMISQRSGGPGDILEIGAGAGLFLKAAERAGWRVAGTEILEAAVEFAREELGLDLRFEAAEELSAPPGSVDVVAMFEVIEHLWDPREALLKARKVLRPGGVLVLSTPNFNSLSRRALGEGWAVVSPAEHLYYFTRKSLERLLARVGFEEVEFVRRHEGCGAMETMNAAHTHTPEKLRTRAYRWFVTRFGTTTYRLVERAGFADTLFCFARPR